MQEAFSSCGTSLVWIRCSLSLDLVAEFLTGCSDYKETFSPLREVLSAFLENLIPLGVGTAITRNAQLENHNFTPCKVILNQKQAANSMSTIFCIIATGLVPGKWYCLHGCDSYVLMCEETNSNMFMKHH